MTIHGTVLDAPMSVVSEWWKYLPTDGVSFEVIPSSDVNVATEFDGVAYRRGVVTGFGEVIAVLPSPGSRISSPSDRPRKFLLILHRRGKRQGGDSTSSKLMSVLVARFCEVGAVLVHSE
jgi:hypothetical protein